MQRPVADASLPAKPGVELRAVAVSYKGVAAIHDINLTIRDGEFLTACEQSCPTNAIVFGNINDPNSRVAKRKAEERDYQVLADLNFRPRTTYMAGVINPNPELA